MACRRPAARLNAARKTSGQDPRAAALMPTTPNRRRPAAPSGRELAVPVSVLPVLPLARPRRLPDAAVGRRSSFPLRPAQARVLSDTAPIGVSLPAPAGPIAVRGPVALRAVSSGVAAPQPGHKQPSVRRDA